MRRLYNRRAARCASALSWPADLLLGIIMLYLSSVVFIALCGYFFLRRNRSPLRSVPAAHWSGRLSSAWILWLRYTGKELQTLIQAHHKHGPIVLVGPGELSISCYQDGIRKVYDSGFPKPAPFYGQFDYYG